MANTTPTPDSFADLDALAAKGTGGALWPFAGPCWSYPGVAVCGENIRVPIESVPDARVQAALAAGTWVPKVLDPDGKPVAIVKAPADGSNVVTFRRADLGTPAAATAA